MPVSLSFTQAAILAGVGLQFRTIDEISEEIELPAKQALALYNKMLRKVGLIPLFP